MRTVLTILLAASMSIISAIGAEPPAQARRLNVLHIIADDLNADLD